MWNLLLWKLFTKHAPGSFSLRAIAISHATKTTRLHSLKPEAKSISFDGGCYMVLIHVLLQWKHFKCDIVPKNAGHLHWGSRLKLPWLYLLKFICILDLIFYFLSFYAVWCLRGPPPPTRGHSSLVFQGAGLHAPSKPGGQGTTAPLCPEASGHSSVLCRAGAHTPSPPPSAKDDSVQALGFLCYSNGMGKDIGSKWTELKRVPFHYCSQGSQGKNIPFFSRPRFVSHEIKRCLLLGRKAMTNLVRILKSRDITLPKKVHLVKATVFPLVIYRCESWTT